ncbi:MAG: SRPBCC domain-containing protein [Ignavibacteria bacterium]|nr:SRPBCC domain-containing protein [Ignavibacteria bacterium]
MTEKNFSSEEFSHGILLNASPEEVFTYLSTGTGISKWFIGSAKYYYGDKSIRLGNETAGKGDSFLWTWLNKDLELKGHVTGSEKGKSFGFTFGPSFLVDINLTESGKRSKLTLTQKYQDSAVKNEFAYINCCVCWVFFLTNLKSVIENNIDLRETEADNELLVNR